MPGVRWMFHATAMGPDYDGIFEPLARLFGCRVLHRQQLPEPVGRDGGMTWIGDNSIEIGAPYGEGSSVAAFVERLGGGMHSVAVQVPDLAATLARLEPLGVEVASRISPEIVFTRPGGDRGAGARVGEPRAGRRPALRGAPLPPFVVEPVVDVERMAFVGAIVRDPVRRRRASRRGARHRAGRRTTHDGAVDVPHGALDLGDCLLALYPVPPDAATSRAVWGGVYERPRWSRSGCPSPTRASPNARSATPACRCTTAPRRSTTRCSSTGLPFPIVLTDRLLGGDPRSYRRPRRNDDQSRTSACGRSSSRRPRPCSPWSCRTAWWGRARCSARWSTSSRVSARSTPCVGSATVRATPARASCTARWWPAPDGAGSTENCKIFAMSAKQRREHGFDAPPTSVRRAPS